MVLGTQIMEFWDWFEDELQSIEQVVSQSNTEQVENIVGSFDQHLLAMGKLKWIVEEVGENHFQLIISPNNDREQLNITTAIVEVAPVLSNWTFFDSIPAKGDYQVTLYDNEMDIQTVDASSWRVCLKKNANRHELKIAVDQTDHIDEDTEMIAVDLILTSLLGERLKIESIADLEVLDEFDAEDLAYIHPIQSLKGLLEGI